MNLSEIRHVPYYEVLRDYYTVLRVMNHKIVSLILYYTVILK